MLAYLNGRFVPTDEAKVSVFDHGFLYGDGVYETMRSYGGKIFLLSRHLARLKQSPDAISLPLPLPLEKIGELEKFNRDMRNMSDEAQEKLQARIDKAIQKRWIILG